MGFKPLNKQYFHKLKFKRQNIGLMVWLILLLCYYVVRRVIILKFENFFIFSKNIQIHTILWCAICYNKIFFTLKRCEKDLKIIYQKNYLTAIFDCMTIQRKKGTWIFGWEFSYMAISWSLFLSLFSSCKQAVLF